MSHALKHIFFGLTTYLLLVNLRINFLFYTPYLIVYWFSFTQSIIKFSKHNLAFTQITLVYYTSGKKTNHLGIC